MPIMIKKGEIVIKLVGILTAFCTFVYGGSVESENKKPLARLYYTYKNSVFKLCFPDQTNSLVYAIPQHALPKKMSEIKIYSDKLIWIPGNDKFIAFGMEPYKAHGGNILYTWDGTNLNKINLARYQTATSSGIAEQTGEEVPLGFSDIYLNDFLISPTGLQIAWNINRLTKVIYDDRGGTSFTAHDVKIASLDGHNTRTVLSEKMTSSGFLADHAESRQLLCWSRLNPDRLFLTTHFESQLNSGSRGLYSLDIKTNKIKLINASVEEMLDFSPDERLIALTPVDETCCGGSNYTNNTVDILDLSSGKSKTIYDEWKEFNNIYNGPDEAKGEEEYYPANALFSPSDDLIAISIAGNKNFATIRRVGTGKEIFKMENSRVIGWIDNDHLLLGKGFKYFHDKDAQYAGLFIYHIKSGKEEILSLRNVVIISMETY